MRTNEERHYVVTCYGPGHTIDPLAPRYATSRAKVGHVAIELLARTFGRRPIKKFWQAKGFMAEAVDRRGNCVTVEQLNDDMLPGWDPRTRRFPLACIDRAE